MTKVQKRFQLQKPLDEAMLQQIADACSIYGIERITIGSSNQDLVVEADATRMRSADIEAALLRAGIPVAA